MYSEQDCVDLVVRFNDALNMRDLDAVMRLMTPDCVFENTHPSPDGTRYEGQPAVREFWERFFAGASETRIEIEEIFAADQRVIMRWIYTWRGPLGDTGHIRGIDLYTLRDGIIAEKLSYVKG